jgi:CoA:oxalate CoA-transferase
MSQATGPLDDVCVLDLSHYYQGPYATLLLSFLGAEVIKIEPPGRGESARTLYKPAGAPVGLPFVMMNSNKRSITLNLKHAEGTEIFKRLVTRADVVVENFTPGVMDKLGLGATVLRELNPRLIYACGTGYGLQGSYRDFPAFDPIVQAMSGIMATSGTMDGPPMKAGPALVDILGGAHLTAAILAAVRQRDRSGEGTIVEIALQDVAIPALSTQVGAYYGMGLRQLRDGNRSPGGAVAPYNAYPTQDGYVMLLADGAARWERLCRVMGRPELAQDQRFATIGARARHKDELDEEISVWTRTRTKQAVMDTLNAADVFCGVIKELPEVMTDANLHERGMLQDIDHPQAGKVTVFTSPLRLGAKATELRTPSPALGQDNDAFYGAELGLNQEELTRLREQGVI